ncbi:MAG: hypothetical protein ACYTG5_02305 [Planctomycetota bacterium]|jgi:hypothetical protein
MSKYQHNTNSQISAAGRNLNAGLGARSRILPRIHDLPRLRKLPGLCARDAVKHTGARFEAKNLKDQEGHLS